MKRNTLAAIMVLLVVSPASAAEQALEGPDCETRDVPRNTLKSLGLGQFEVLSDLEGMQVRGRAGADAASSSMSLRLSTWGEITATGGSTTATDTGVAEATPGGLNASLFTAAFPSMSSSAANSRQGSAVSVLLGTSSLVRGVPSASFTGAATIRAGSAAASGLGGAAWAAAR
jgi:hypothetical protein